MPIYAYRCLKCAAEPEFIQKMSDPPMTECESCGGELVRKVTSAAFHLKGGGWYKDGYASTKPEGGGGEGDQGDKGDKGGGEAKPESKPAESKASGESSAAPSTPAKAATP